jgi:hypothetical protein
MAQSHKQKTVALVGFASTSRDLAPWDKLDIEIWGMNEAYTQPFMKRWDRWFQLHSSKIFQDQDANRNDPHHWDWLQAEHTFPIYMQKKYAKVPAAVRYPIEDALDLSGHYLCSSAAFMISLAILEGFERIELYGFDMAANTEYFYQRANMEYLIGLAKGRGIAVYIPPVSALLRSPIYGYQSHGIAFRQQLELRDLAMDERLAAKRDEFEITNGRILELDFWKGRTPPVDDKGKPIDPQMRRKELMETVEQQRAEYNSFAGSQAEIKNIIKMYDRYDTLEVVDEPES